MKNLVFVVTLTLAFVVGWKLGVVTVQPEETALRRIIWSDVSSQQLAIPSGRTVCETC